MGPIFLRAHKQQHALPSKGSKSCILRQKTNLFQLNADSDTEKAEGLYTINGPEAQFMMGGMCTTSYGFSEFTDFLPSGFLLTIQPFALTSTSLPRWLLYCYQGKELLHRLLFSTQRLF